MYDEDILLYYLIVLTSGTYNIISEITVTSEFVKERWSFFKTGKWKKHITKRTLHFDILCFYYYY